MPSETIPSPWGSISAYLTRKGTLRYRLRGYVDGDLRSVGSYDTAEEAQEVAQATLEALSSRALGLTVGRWVEAHLTRREQGGRHRAVTSSRQVLEQHVMGTALADMLLRAVKPKHVRQWIHGVAGKRATRGKRRGEPLARQTVANALRALSACMSDAVDAGKIPANPCVGVRIPKEAPRTDDPFVWLDAAERQALADLQMPLRRRAAYWLAMYAGLRAGEVCGLRWQDVRELDGEDPHLVVCRSFGGPTKGNRSRRVILLPPVVDALRRYRAQGGTAFGELVFLGRGNRPHTTGYDFEWARWRAKAGIRPEATFHALRRTCGVCLVSGSWGKAWDLGAVQVQLGHASRTTTERHYARFEPHRMERVAREARAEWEG